MQIYKYTNKRINKFFGICILGFVCILYLGFWNLASAGAACTPVYGGGLTCSGNTLTIQKQVQKPGTNTFVHNLGLSDAKFHANDTVTFQITLTNTGNSALDNVVVKDTLPDALTFVSGPGNFDASKHLLTFTVQNIASHKTQQYLVKTTVESQDKFPESTFCATNSVSALPSSGSIVQDSSQFCAEKLNSTPATGANPVVLLSLIPIAFLGIGIKKLGYINNY